MYKVVKRVGKKRYAYLQRSYRVGKRVKTESVYLGPANAEAAADFARNMATLERENQQLDEWQRKTFGETGAERQAREAHASKFSQQEFLNDTQEKAPEDGGKED